jgi:ferredoxin-NADP reductase
MVRYNIKITDIIEEIPSIKTFLLEKPSDFNWKEGSHTHIGLLGFDAGEKPNKALVRHMSIMTLPEENKIGFTTRIMEPLSEFKESLSELHIGDEVVLFKVGSRIPLRRENKPIVLLSMGVAIATMRPLIHRFIQDRTGIPRLTNININSSNNFVYKKELTQLENSQYQNHWVDTRSKFYETLDTVTEQDDSLYYLVGRDDFLKDVIKYLKEKGIDETSILIDKKQEKRAKYF